MMKLIPRSLYIHFPWCIRKCPYCDFHSLPCNSAVPEKKYVEALLKDLEEDLNRFGRQKFVSIFIGGGTPSLLSPQALAQLLDGINVKVALDKNIEITLEANPGTFDHEKIKAFRQIGINRLSIGIQSFQNEQLKILGRIHTGEKACDAIRAAQKAGFENINLDLMHGLPNQTVEDALVDLHEAVSFSPTHLSWYQLTIEPETPFGKASPTLPEESVLEEIQRRGHDYLIQQDYEHYEISAYCRPKNECQHNLNYWQFGDYLGIGASAHGKMTIDNKIVRTEKIKDPLSYLEAIRGSSQIVMANARHQRGGEDVFLRNGSPTSSRLRLSFDENILSPTVLSTDEIPLEFMMNALRLVKGFPTTLFEARTGLHLSSCEHALVQAVKEQWLNHSDQWIQPTSLGLRFLNDVIALF
jgi:oxygen-independent coproporphyrinogen-3 oxidase